MHENDLAHESAKSKDTASRQQKNVMNGGAVTTMRAVFWTGLSLLATALTIVPACSKKQKQDDCLALYTKVASCKKDFSVPEKEFVGLCRERHSDPVVTAQLGCSPSLDCAAFQKCLDQARIKGALIRLRRDLAALTGKGQVSDLLLRCSRLRKNLSRRDLDLCRKQAQTVFDDAAALVKKKRDRADTSNLWQVCGSLQQASNLLGGKKKQEAKLLCEEARSSLAFRAVLLSKEGSPDRKRACIEATKALENLKGSTWAGNQAPLLLTHCMGVGSRQPMMQPHLTLRLQNDGTMLIQGRSIKSLQELPGALVKAHEAHPKLGIVIEYAKGSAYSELVAVLDAARKAGFTKFALSGRPIVDGPPNKKRSPRRSR